MHPDETREGDALGSESIHDAFSWSGTRSALRQRRMHRSLRIIVAFGLLVSFAGCEPVPAVKRGKIAHPTMTAEEISIGLEGHVRAVSEGATGALGGGGGGCGCN